MPDPPVAVVGASGIVAAVDVVALRPDIDAVTLLPVAVAALLVIARRSWRVLRTGVTIAHEAGHMGVALLVGRRLRGIRVHADASGVTLSRGRPRGPGMVATVAAGYPAPSLLGLLAATLTASGRHVVSMVVAVALLAGMLLAVRNVFGGVSIAAFGVALVGVGWYAPDPAPAVGAAVLAWFLLFGGLRAVVELPRARRGRDGRDSDPDQLARLTHLPGWLWVAAFVAVSLASVVTAGSLLLR